MSTTTFPHARFPLPVIPAKAGIQCLLAQRLARIERHWMTRCARPFEAALRAFRALRACPAFAGMTVRQARGVRFIVSEARHDP
jgi:hypothetical protein